MKEEDKEETEGTVKEQKESESESERCLLSRRLVINPPKSDLLKTYICLHFVTNLAEKEEEKKKEKEKRNKKERDRRICSRLCSLHEI